MLGSVGWMVTQVSFPEIAASPPPMALIYGHRSLLVPTHAHHHARTNPPDDPLPFPFCTLHGFHMPRHFLQQNIAINVPVPATPSPTSPVATTLSSAPPIDDVCVGAVRRSSTDDMAELERDHDAMLQRRKTARKAKPKREATEAATNSVRQGKRSEAVGTEPVDEDPVSATPSANSVKPDGAGPADEGLASAVSPQPEGSASAASMHACSAVTSAVASAASIANACATDAEPAGQASGVGSAAPADSNLAGTEPPAHVVEFAPPENRSDGAGESAMDGTGAKKLGLASGGDVSESADDDFAAVAQAQATVPPRPGSTVRSASQLPDVVNVAVRYDGSPATTRILLLRPG